MTPDHLDALLERSAPPTYAADPADLRAMIVSAAQQERSKRRRRTGIMAGVLSLMLVSGTGVAAASSPWLWAVGMNSSRSYTYTSPTWGQCELRQGNFVAADPFRQFELDRVIDEWFATANVSAEVEPLIGESLDVVEESQANKSEPITDPRLPDLNYWAAVDQAVHGALYAELVLQGFDQGSVTSSASQVHCAGEQWK
ncbi:hypothetical protein [Microbacterium maritypicum]|uniref:hypothetical protein n=1 Tax=Microbacterium maritypicum TaxID=33918 RepID=UPI0038011E80